MDLTTDEVTALLSEFVHALRGEVDTSGEAAVPGMGTFRRDGSGLSFRADDELRSAVNFRYDGLLSVDVVSREEEEIASTAFVPVDDGRSLDADDRQHGDAESPADLQDGFDDEPEDADATAEVPQDEDNRQTFVPPMISRRSEEPEAAAVSSDDLDEAPEDDVQPDVREEVGSDEFSPSPAEAETAEDEVAPMRPPAGSSVPDPDADGRSRTSPAWIMTAVIAAILVAVGIFMFVVDRPAQDLPPTIEEPPPTAEDATDVDDAGVIAEERADDDEDTAEQPAVDEPAAPTAEASPLYGDSIDTTISQYTLVVASLPSESSANEVAGEWRERGIRTAVFSESTGAGTRYRVGIGQFDTIALADSVRSQSDISSELPQGTWVFRYPANIAE